MIDTSVEETSERIAVWLFTDIVDSVGLQRRLGTREYSILLETHDRLYRQALSHIRDSEHYKDTGDGHIARFDTAASGVNAALKFQSLLRLSDWPSEQPMVRLGLHQGHFTELHSGNEGEAKLVGMPLNIASRIMGLAEGGQILLTRAVFDDARQYVRNHPGVEGLDDIPKLEWMAHGRYAFQGSDEPMEIFEVGVPGEAPLRAPVDTGKARRVVSEEDEATLGWRPAPGLEIPRRPGWLLERKLGVGSFGEVWMAKHSKLRENRVFKFCFDVDRLRSFKRELTLFRLIRRALGNREDIAVLYDIQLEQPPFFLELEYAEEGDLKTWAEARGGIAKIPLEDRLRIVAKVAAALAAAHSVGIIHKDIKPSNILIRETDSGEIQPLLIDFGIGFVTDSSKLEELGITEAGFTETMPGANESSRTGTRMYAPPETLAGEPFTIQGDIYAVGVLLFQMVVGDFNRPLATGWEREIPDDALREDIAKCVEGNPDRRWESAAELAENIVSLRRRKQTLRRLLGSIAAILTVIASVVLLHSELARTMENRGYDLLAEQAPTSAPNSVLIVGIDSDSLFDQPWPLPRSVWADLIGALREAGAEVIVFDLLFPAPSELDPEFAKAIRSHPRVILGGALTRQTTYSGATAKELILPRPEFLDAGAKMGVVNMYPDFDDGVVRRRPTERDERTLAEQAALLAAGDSVVPEGSWKEGQFIRFYGPPGTIPSVGLEEALAPNRFKPGALTGKVVFVGPTAEIFQDQMSTPVGTISGVELHATSYLNLRRDEGIGVLGSTAVHVLLILSGLVIGFGLLQLRILTAVVVASLAALAAYMIARWLFLDVGLLVPWQMIVWIQIPLVAACYLFSHVMPLKAQRRAGGLWVGILIRLRTRAQPARLSASATETGANRP